MKGIITIFLIAISLRLSGQSEESKMMEEVNIDISKINEASWKSYNEKLTARPLVYSGRATLVATYYKANESLSFESKVYHEKGEIAVVFKNLISDKNTEDIVKKVIQEVFRIATSYYYRANQKGAKPYEEFARERGNNTWSFNVYREEVKKSLSIEDKKSVREVTLNNAGEIEKVVTTLTHKTDSPNQKLVRDHHIEISLSPHKKGKRKYSEICGEIINVENKNRIAFHIDFR